MMNDRPQFDRAQSLGGEKWRPYATLEDKLFRKERAREFHRMGGRRGIPQEPKPCKCGCEGSRYRHMQLRTVRRLCMKLWHERALLQVLKQGVCQGDPWTLELTAPGMPRLVRDVLVGDGHLVARDPETGRWTHTTGVPKHLK